MFYGRLVFGNYDEDDRESSRGSGCDDSSQSEMTQTVLGAASNYAELRRIFLRQFIRTFFIAD